MRWLLLVLILLDLGLVVVFLEARGTRLRYELARKQEACRGVARENSKLLLSVAKGKRWKTLAARAEQMGLALREEERGSGRNRP